jgi:polysaccharide biosynthesis/export protein
MISRFKYNQGCFMLFSALIFLYSFSSFSQQVSPNSVSNDQLLQYYQQAKASGLSDMQIEQAAMAKGYTLSDISKLRERLMQAQNPVNATVTKRDTAEVSRQQESIPSVPTIESVSYNQPEKQGVFGSEFFRNNTTLTFEPNLRLATPKDYILGPDDELLVDIYGNAVDNLRLKVSPDGTVKMLNLAPVYINGLTIEEASERIISRLRQAYSGLNLPGSNTRATITLSGVRSIKVMITGATYRPGTYTVSSLATAFNALYLSGGPNEIGSFRKIEVIRNNNVIRKIDLYNFLVNADLKDNVALRDQDIILITPYETRVTLTGEVKRTGKFELKAGETFNDVLRFAGGFTEEAYTESINYQRNTGKELRVGAISPDAFGTFIPKSGDIFSVGKILDRFENRVVIQGAVYRPGSYALEESAKTVKNLIIKAEGLRENAFLNRALISREQENLEPLLISFDLGKLMRGEIADIPLKRQDEIIIKTVQEMRENYTVSIAGAVQNPGLFAYRDSMSVSDLIYLAGGYTEAAIPYRVEVARRVKEDTTGLPSTQNVVISTFDVDKSLKQLGENRKFRLKPFDLVFVRTSPRYESQRTVSIQGEVLYPGRYAILNNAERISDVLQRAGGLKPNAYLAGARLTRQITRIQQRDSELLEDLVSTPLLDRESTSNQTSSPSSNTTSIGTYSSKSPKSIERQLVGLDLLSILSNPNQPANILIQDGDSLIIPRRVETVRIIGEVLNPSLVNYDPKYSFNDYISQAGGYTDNARKHKVFLSYANGRINRTKRFLFFVNHPTIKPGTTINVPQRVAKRENTTTPAERIAIISLISTLIFTAIRLF